MGLNKNSTTIRLNNATCERINKCVKHERYSWDVKVNLILDMIDEQPKTTNKEA